MKTIIDTTNQSGGKKIMNIESRKERLVEIYVCQRGSTMDSGTWDTRDVTVDASLTQAEAEESALDTVAELVFVEGLQAFIGVFNYWNDEAMKPIWDRLDNWDDVVPASPEDSLKFMQENDINPSTAARSKPCR